MFIGGSLTMARRQRDTMTKATPLKRRCRNCDEAFSFPGEIAANRELTLLTDQWSGEQSAAGSIAYPAMNSRTLSRLSWRYVGTVTSAVYL